MRTDLKIGAVVAVCLLVIALVWYFAMYDRGRKPDDSTGAAGTGTPTSPGGRTNEIDLAGETGTPSESDTGEPAGTEPGLIRPRLREPLPGLGRTPSAAADTTGSGDAGTSSTDLARVDTDSTGGLPEPPAEEPTPILPREAARLPAVVDTSPGTLDSSPIRPAVLGGGKTYVVQKGDSFWTIADREYGDGRLFKVIQQANPNVAPRSLREGMTITIPEKPAAAAVMPAVDVVASADHGKVETDPVTGKQYYIVKKGDRGFWDVAKIVYSQGKYYRAIAAANPELNPRNLKPGMKVWVPDRPEEMPAAAAGLGAGAAVAVPTVRVRTGAPTMARLPDGKVFD